MKLNKREKYAIYVAAGFLGLFIVLQFVVFPMIDKRDRLTKTLQVKLKTIEEMLALKSEYDTIVKQADLSKVRFANRKKGFTLFSFLDELAGDTGIKNNITYMKPSTSAQKDSALKISLVEMKLQAVTLRQLTAYLYRVETSANIVFIKRISVSKTDRPAGSVNAILQVETYEI